MSVVTFKFQKEDMSWKRPDSVPRGQIWSRFKGREKNGVPAKMYHICDMDDEYKDQCIELMLETFLRDEPLCQALDIQDDPASVSTIISNWTEYISQGISLACFEEVGRRRGALVGFNILVARGAEDPEEDIEQVKGDQWRKLLKTLVEAEELVNIFKVYDVDRYLTSSGLTVLPAHRGQNIGLRFFEARKPLCKALGINATATVFTATTSQALARKAGFDTLAELKYSDMKKYGIDLSRSTTPTAVLMGTRYHFDKE